MSSEFDSHERVETDSNALKREWLIARIVIAVGFVAAFGALAFFTFGPAYLNPQPAGQNTAATSGSQTSAEEKAETATAAQVCKTALSSAKSFGIVPNFTKLTDPYPHATDVTGRYVCNAATTAAKYALATDLVCRDVKNVQCVSLYSITSDDGTVLYQRHDQAN